MLLDYAPEKSGTPTSETCDTPAGIGERLSAFERRWRCRNPSSDDPTQLLLDELQEIKSLYRSAAVKLFEAGKPDIRPVQGLERCIRLSVLILDKTKGTPREIRDEELVDFSKLSPRTLEEISEACS